MRGARLALLALPLLAGCELFETEAPAPVPPPPPPTRPVRAQRPRPAEPPRQDAAAEAPAPTPPAPTPEPETQAAAVEPQRPDAPRVPVWRVVADRTVGCAVPETVRLLRGTEGLTESQPRLAAQARNDGRCSTVFRVNEWTLLRMQGDVVLLRLANPPAGVGVLELYFMRRDVIQVPMSETAPAG